jgi:McbB family protein
MIPESVTVKPFNLLKIDQDSLIVYTELGVSTVNDAGLEQVLSVLAGRCRETISASELRLLFEANSLDLKSAYNYLSVTARIVSPSISRKRLVNMSISSSENQITQCLQSVLAGLPEMILNGEASSSTLHVLIQEVYRPMAIEAFYASLDENDAVLTGYNFGGAFYLDAPYSRASGLPCHFCQREYHLAGAAARYGEAAGQWSELIRKIDRSASHLGGSLPLSEGDRHAILGLVWHSVRRLLGIDGMSYDRRPGFCAVLSYRTGEIERHLIPHDPDCSCIRTSQSFLNV